MDIDELNRIFSKLENYSLSPISEDGLSSTRLENGTELYIIAGSKTLIMSVEVENLGNAGSENPDIFRHLLSVNILGGRYGNLRIGYDEASSTVWVCYDIIYEILTADLLEEKLKNFIENAPKFATLIREEIIYTYIDEQKPSAESHINELTSQYLNA